MAFLSIFRLVRLLLVLSYPYLCGSYRFRSSGCRGIGRLVGYIVGGWRRRDLVSRPSVSFYPSRSSVRSIFPYRLVGGMRVPFLSACSTASSVGGGSVSFSLTRYARLFVSSLFSLPRLVWRLVSILCGSLVVSFGSSIRWRLVVSSRPAGRFLVLFIVPRCFALLGSSFLVSCSRLVRSSRQAVRILLFRLAARLGGSWCRVVFFRLVLFCSRRILFVVSHGHGGGGSSFSSRCGVLNPIVPSWNPIGRWRWRNECTVFLSSFSSSGNDDRAIWISPQGRRT